MQGVFQKCSSVPWGCPLNNRNMERHYFNSHLAFLIQYWKYNFSSQNEDVCSVFLTITVIERKMKSCDLGNCELSIYYQFPKSTATT